MEVFMASGVLAEYGIYFWILMVCINTNIECSYKVRDAVVAIFLYTMMQILCNRASTWKRVIGILCPVVLYCGKCRA